MTGILAVMAALRRTTGGGGGGDPPPPDPVLDTETVTVGVLASKFFTDYGFRDVTGMGSISNGTFAPKSASIEALYWSSLQNLVFSLDGTHANSGWTTMKVGSTTFTRASATFSQSGGQTHWTWSSIASNPFSGAGTNTTVVFE